jgi:hypothetical protein
MFDLMFPDGVRRGMAFDAVSHPRVFVTKNGSALTAADWAKLKLKARRALAFDDLPESVRAPHAPAASDAEHRVEMLRHYLRGRGLDEESIEEACEHARRDMAEVGEVEDELPVSGPAGAGGKLSKQSREPDEKVFRSPGHFERRSPLGTLSSHEKRSLLGEAEYRSSPASDGFERMFPEAARIKAFPEPHQWREERQARDRRRLAGDAAAADESFFKMFPDARRIGVGDWPSRR